MDDAQGFIRFEDEYTQRAYVAVNRPSREITLHMGDYAETHLIGEMLADFVTPEKDRFKFYEEDRLELIQNLHLVDASASEMDYSGVMNEFIENYIRKHGISRDEFAKKVAIFDFLKRFAEVHPYFYAIGFYSTILPTDNDTLLNDVLNLETIREKALEIVRFCLDAETDRLNQLDAAKRYFTYLASGRGKLPCDFKTRIIAVPDRIPVEDYRVFYKPLPKGVKAKALFTLTSFADLKQPQDITDSTIEYIKKADVRVDEAYEVNSITDMVYLELYQMILCNVSVRKCGVCGRYFVRKGDYNEKYCDRIPRGYKQTCQQIGSTRDYNQRNKQSKPRAEYMKAYKRMHSRIKYGMITKDEFKQWNLKANDILRLCDSGEVPLEEFKQWLRNK